MPIIQVLHPFYNSVVDIKSLHHTLETNIVSWLYCRLKKKKKEKKINSPILWLWSKMKWRPVCQNRGEIDIIEE